MQQLNGSYETSWPAADIADEKVVTLVGEECIGRCWVDGIVEQGGSFGRDFRGNHDLNVDSFWLLRHQRRIGGQGGRARMWDGPRPHG
jgi:hypothetical protein